MNDTNDDFINKSQPDSGLPPSPGKNRTSASVAKLRKRLSGRDIEKVRAAEERDAEQTADFLERQRRNAPPSDLGLVMIFARLYVAGASMAQMSSIAKTIRSLWPVFSANDVAAARSLAEGEIDAARRAKSQKNEEPNVVDRNGFDELVAYAAKQLKSANSKPGATPDIYRHGSEVVRVVRDAGGAHQIEILSQKTFNHALNTQAAFRKTFGDDGYRSVSAPRDVAEHLYSAPALPLPTLEKVVTVPTFTKEGRLIHIAGFDSGSGLLYLPMPGLNIPIPGAGNLTTAAAQAFAALVDLFADFPFDGNRRAENVATPPPSLVNFIGLLITPFVAPIVDNVVPAHLMTKPAPGTGASLLAEVCQIIADGKSELRPPLSKNEEERRKALFTMLQQPRNFTIFDNIAGEMDSNTFASFLTSRDWTDRILGRTGERTVKNSTAVIMTGINPGFTSELTRRLSLIKLDAREANPELRSDFKHDDIKGYVSQHRGEIIGHILVLIQHWINKGMPRARGVALASFEPWFRTVGGILEAAGMEGFQANRAELATVTNATVHPIQHLVELWYAEVKKPGSRMTLSAFAGGEHGLLKLAQDNEVTLPVRLKRSPIDDFDFSPEGFGRYLGACRDMTFSIEHNGRRVTVSLTQGKRASGGTPWALTERADATNTDERAKAGNVVQMGRTTPSRVTNGRGRRQAS